MKFSQPHTDLSKVVDAKCIWHIEYILDYYYTMHELVNTESQKDVDEGFRVN